MNSRDNHKGSIVILRKPSKKRMKLNGKTVYDKYNNNVGQTVWNRQVKTIEGRRITVYVLSKCDKEGCSGTLKIDSRGYKCCVRCGLGLNKDENYICNLQSRSESYKHEKKFDYFLIYNGNTDENIEVRNNLWDNLELDKLIYWKDKGSEKLLERYKNIRDWETEHKKAVDQKEVDNDLLHSNNEKLPSTIEDCKI